jgi:SAM-dependent methyltransferase
MALKSICSRLIQKFRREGVSRTLVAFFQYPFGLFRRNRYRHMLELQSPKQRFAAIYKNNFWLSKESGSGSGSELENTKSIRSELPLLVRKFGIKSIVDAPCGDLNWMRLVLSEVDVSYIGLDIVDKVIEGNKKNILGENIKFSVADICDDKIPDCDLLMVRDCLFHLSYDDIEKFLNNISGCQYRYLLTSNHTELGDSFKNQNIVTGDFRLIDLFSQPFLFDKAKVMHSIRDDIVNIKGVTKREMSLFSKADVPRKIQL